MTALLSALIAIATVVGLWFAAAVVSVPILVVCVRSQGRANARRAAQVRREGWARSASR